MKTLKLFTYLFLHLMFVPIVGANTFQPEVACSCHSNLQQIQTKFIYISPADASIETFYEVGFILAKASTETLKLTEKTRFLGGPDNQTCAKFNVSSSDVVLIFVSQFLPFDTTSFDSGNNGTLIVNYKGNIIPLALQFYQPGIAFSEFTF